MREKQKTLVERMKPIFPRLTQPAVSAASAPVQSGVQFTNRLRRAAGWEPEHRDLDRRYNFRLFPDEGDQFDELVRGSGRTKQEILRELVIRELIRTGRRSDG